ncbi:hypothetical protein MJO28_004189 [Puccinia striiformis f. sp. tritici]|uniref:Uncharacterized protein n=1 Tax=Puccinia striiformis f. sp. tritici TaxID=168172 RepID=A0ACC0EN89_9BASI|nr:hypothetical protein MJO28_004189 [Puccinia striiformis f. sp. tritici]
MDILRSENFARLFNPFLRLIEEKVQCPQALASDYPDHEFQQIASLELNKHESIKKAHFVLTVFLYGLTFLFYVIVKVNTARSGKYVAQVNSVWKSGASFFAHVTRLQRSKINDFYMMREFTKTSTTCSIKVKKTMPRKKKRVGKKMVDMSSDEEWGSSGEIN